MTTTLPPSPYGSCCLTAPSPLLLTEAAMRELEHLLPPTAHALISALGWGITARLISRIPGVIIKVPASRDASPQAARRWDLLLQVLEEPELQRLAAAMPGELLRVPSCAAAREEWRNRWLRARFDVLIADDRQLTKEAVVYELGVELAALGQPMTYRQIETCIDQGDLTALALAQRRSAAAAARAAGQEELFPLSEG